MATLTISDWAPGDSSGYLEQVSKRAPALIDPADAPVYKGLETRPVVGYRFDWLTDALSSNVLDAGTAFEGEPTYATSLARGRVNNFVQFFRRLWSISEYAEIIAKNGGIAGGIVSEVSRQIMLKMKEVARAIERAIMSEQTGIVEGHSGATSSLMGGYFNVHTTNVTDAGAALLTAYIDESAFNAMIKTLYKAGASANLWCVTTPDVAEMISGTFKGREQARETVERGGHTIDNVVEKYVARVGGEVMIQPDRSIGECCAIMDRDQVAVGEADPIRVFRRDTGSFQNLEGRIRTYVTYLYGNEKASGGWKNDNTPATSGQ